MELDPLFLSRLQFAFVIAFHILLPAFTVGLASFILLLEGLHLVKRDPVYLRLSVFWTRIFAVSFGMGVVSGIVMPFQFGTNWSRYTDATGNVLGPLSPPARCSRRSGSLPRTAGCRRPRVTRWSTAVSCRRAGSR
jgi:cytochrome d ubiquinol oxidase subunit I